MTRLRKLNPKSSVVPTSRVRLGGSCVNGDSISLGVCSDGEECRLDFNDVGGHIVVTGAPGMGKSYATKLLARRLHAAGINVVVIEPVKPEYADALPEAVALGSGPGRCHIRFNPFQVDSGVPVRAHVQDLADCFVSALQLDEGPLPSHTLQLLARQYRNAGIPLESIGVAGMVWPTVVDLQGDVGSYVEQEVRSGPEVSSNVHGALHLRATRLAWQGEFLTRVGLTSGDLCSHSHILELVDMGGDMGALLAMCLLARLLRYSRSLGSRRLHTVVILEEAHSLLARNGHGEANVFADLYSRCLAEMKANGFGFVTVDQQAGMLPRGCLACSGTHIHFAPRYADDIRVVADSLGVRGDLIGKIPGLPCGQALIRRPGDPGPKLLLVG